LDGFTGDYFKEKGVCVLVEELGMQMWEGVGGRMQRTGEFDVAVWVKCCFAAFSDRVDFYGWDDAGRGRGQESG